MKLRTGYRYRWEPGLRMDPDTGKVVEPHPIASASSFQAWKVRVVKTGRVLTVYADELKPGPPVTLAIRCGSCGAVDTSSEGLFAAGRNDEEAEAALQESAATGRFESWTCPSCGGDAAQAQVIELG